MHYRILSLLLLAVVLGLVAVPAQSQSTGNCEAAIGEAYLDINNVRARILNNGNLFWRGSPHVYNIPKGGPSNAIFASGIWLGGSVNGQLRVAASRYGPYEFWAGPLGDDGSPPANCDSFDRVFKVSKEDVVNYDGTGTATPDLADWPTGLGAPTLDANGDLIDLTSQPLASRLDRKINLGSGERPAILGDQMLWWVMNDRGNVHNATDTPPIGLEAHVSAFAFNTAGAIGNTTFYKYRLFYKGSSPLENTYMGIFSDPDLGNFDDDYVGSDTTLGLGYVYNADNDDEGGEGYGEAPPAAGYDFFQGPLVDDDGMDNNGDGQVDEAGERLKMTTFAFYNNGGGVIGDPTSGPDYYNYMRGRWKDGQRFTLGGNGRDFSNIPTNFHFPGAAENGEFWTELNSDGQGTSISPADRRFVMSTGPFTIRPNDEQEIVFGVVTSFGSDNLDSVRQMKADDLLAQAVFDINFELPSPPASPRVTTTPGNSNVLIQWGYRTTDNNYLDGYNVIDPLLSSDVTDNDYQFEGYNVFQYASRADQEGKRLATYDKVNGIKRVVEGTEITFVTAEGNDTGVLHYHQVGGLTNYQTYYFGVQAYAYNATSGQKVYAGPINRFSVVPSTPDVVTTPEAQAFASAAAANIAAGTSAIEASVGASNIGNGGAGFNVINPAELTGLDYSVEFFTVDTDASKRAWEGDDSIDAYVPSEANKSAAANIVTYDVLRSDGVKVFDGAEAVAQTGKGAPEGIDVVGFDGLSLNVAGAPNGFLDFAIVANANGPLATPQGAAADWEGFPITSRPDDDSQVTTDGHWMIVTGQSGGCAGGDCGPLASFVDRSVTQRGGWSVIVPFDWEIRWTYEADNYAWDAFNTGAFVNVPYELWRTGIATPDDPSDDLRFTSFFFDACGADAVFDMCDSDHQTSGGANDPFSDWIYWYGPVDETPGEGGYQAWAADAVGGGDPGNVGTHTFGRMAFMNWNGGDTGTGDPAVYDAFNYLPETGSIFRINTTKPNQPGDTFSLSTAGLGARAETLEEQVADLDQIGISPNPYKGASAYEVSQLVDQVRFTNMPNQATIRVFSLNGTLITTLEKNSSAKSFGWDMTTEEGLPIASGMYIIHVDVPGIGEKVIKFGVIKKRVQLNTF
jgi:hypothetical protein